MRRMMNSLMIRMWKNEMMVSYNRGEYGDKEKKPADPSSRPKGRWHNDYSPRYKKPYDIYEKAASHIRDIKRKKEN